MNKSPTYLVRKESFTQLYTKPYLDADFYFYYFFYFLFSVTIFLRTCNIFCSFFFAIDFMMKYKKGIQGEN